MPLIVASEKQVPIAGKAISLQYLVWRGTYGWLLGVVELLSAVARPVKEAEREKLERWDGRGGMFGGGMARSPRRPSFISSPTTKASSLSTISCNGQTLLPM